MRTWLSLNDLSDPNWQFTQIVVNWIESEENKEVQAQINWIESEKNKEVQAQPNQIVVNWIESEENKEVQAQINWTESEENKEVQAQINWIESEENIEVQAQINWIESEENKEVQAQINWIESEENKEVQAQINWIESEVQAQPNQIVVNWIESMNGSQDGLALSTVDILKKNKVLDEIFGQESTPSDVFRKTRAQPISGEARGRGRGRPSKDRRVLGEELKNETSRDKIRRLLNIYSGRKHREKVNFLQKMLEQDVDKLEIRQRSLQLIYENNERIINQLGAYIVDLNKPKVELS
jgi:hypothetical protein